MKFSRPTILMIIGGLLVLLLIVIWIYLLFFRTTPAGEDRFADMNFADLGGLGEGTDPDARPANGGNGPDQGTDAAGTDAAGDGTDPGASSGDGGRRVALTNEPLQQLTTGPVVGFREISSGTSTDPTLLYMEAGTGHIYAINMETGALTRRTNTTIPNIQGAAFSADGRFVAGIIGDTREHRAFIAPLTTDTSQLTLSYLEDPVLEYTIPDTNHLLYTTRNREGTTGKSRDLASGATSQLFQTPILSLAVAWGDSPSDTHHIYPRASRRLEGFLAAVDGGSIRRLPIDGFGLTAVPTAEGVIYSFQTVEGVYGSRFLATGASESGAAGAIALPRKCEPSVREPSTVWCATQFDRFTRSLPDDWYAGELTFSDSLFALDTDSGSAQRLIGFTAASGRTIDAVDLSINDAETSLYFRNKLDNTLWYYDLR